jgi:serine/threonine protein kinase
MIPVAKIQELQNLTRDNILKPLDILLDKNSKPIGFTMKWIRDSIAMCKLFTTDFRTRSKIAPSDVVTLVESIASTMSFIHSKQCLVVDFNEMNMMIDSKFKIPYFIDVDSYQTPNFQANAIMPSIRDVHSTTFSELTDWFSFAIVTCQLFIGIHPFKGKHPDFPKADFVTRMKNNASIFNPKILLPATVRDFSYIPKEYLEWYIRLFEKGERSLPPTIGGVIIAVAKPTVAYSQTFTIKCLSTQDIDIIGHFSIMGVNVYLTKAAVHMNAQRFTLAHPDSDVLILMKTLTPVEAYIEDGRLVLWDMSENRLIPITLYAKNKMIIDNRLFVLSDDKLIEVTIQEMNHTAIAAIGNVWSVHPNASQMMRRVLYQDLLGKPFFLIPHKNGSAIMQTFPGLDGYKIIDARYENGVLVVIRYKNGIYDRVVIVINPDTLEYTHRAIKDVGNIAINFTVLDNGVALLLTEDDEIELFFNSPDKTALKIIKDSGIDSSMKLSHNGTVAMYMKDNKAYSITSK